MHKPFLILLLLISVWTNAQELFVYTEPASNIAARSIRLRATGQYYPFDRVYDRPASRLVPELSIGLHRKLMLSLGGSFSNMHTYHFKMESLFAYGKYRFLAHDALHQHFRMAAFVMASHTQAPFHYDEVELTGDKSGVQLGVAATQLWNLLALSGSISHIQVLDKSRHDEVVYVPERIYETMNYSLSTGYLVLPRHYSTYKQVGVNLYLEMLAQQALDHPRYFVDLGPALQLIFFSNTQLNFGYRFQLTGDAQRISKTSWLVSLDRNFLNVWKAKISKKG
jgi:hypothetical protein